MNKKLPIIVGAVLVIVLLGAGVFFFMRKPKAPAMTTTGEEVQTQQQTGSMKKRSSLRDLMGLGQNLTCTYSDAQGKSVGTMYVSGADVRSDFDVTTPEGDNLVSHMITDGTTVYIWTDGQAVGFKQTLTAMEDSSGETTEESGETQTVNVDEEVDFDCNNWTVDRSKFDLPTGVEFSDFSTMMQDAMQKAATENTEDETQTTTQTDPCSACDALQGDTKTQCLQALGC